MAGTGTFEGANARLYVDTQQAIAQLLRLRTLARQTRGELGGMPVVAPNPTKSPLIAPVPSGEVPGSGAQLFMVAPEGNTAVATNPNKLSSGAKKAAKGRTVNGIHIPDAPKSAAPKRNGMFGLSRSTAPNPSTAAGSAAVRQRWSQLMSEAKAGPQLRTEDVTLGPVKVGRQGVSLRSAEALLGPAAIFSVAIYAGMRGAAALGESVESALAEATATGKDLGEVLVEKAKHIPGKAAAAVTDFVIDTVLDASEGVGKFGVGVMAALGWQSTNQADGNIQAYKKVFSDTKQELDDALAVLTGGKQKWEITRDRFKALSSIEKKMRNEAAEQALDDAKKTAESLLGMGFPGTLDELRSKEGPVYQAYLDKYNEDVDQRLLEIEYNEGVTQ